MPFKNDVWKIKLLFETVLLLKTMVNSSGGMEGKKLGFEKREHGKPWQVSWKDRYESYTLQGTNISHHWKRKIIFKVAFWRDMVVPGRAYTLLFEAQDKSIQILSVPWFLWSSKQDFTQRIGLGNWSIERHVQYKWVFIPWCLKIC